MDQLFDTAGAAYAAALAPAAAAGHYDELRATSTGVREPLGPAWTTFFASLGHEGFADLHRRTANLQRQVRDNGITYNVHADARGPQRPWSLDLFPLLVDAAAWSGIEAGVLQRVKLLDRVMDDVYGAQELLRHNLLPPALVQGHRGYLRAMHGVKPPGGTHLHIAAFDLARDVAGVWWVVSQRTQAPSGLGYLLENRLIVSRLFPEAFRDMKVQRLAATYRAFADGLRAMCPGEDEPRIVLLTPGPYNETYFEHAYLARYLGLTLVEGGDLTVRGDRLFLKTLQGLEPVHGILKRLDDEFLDPLELRPDSQLGVPGLLQAVRAGNVLVANAPGSAFLESRELLEFLPAIAHHLLGEALRLPSEMPGSAVPLAQMPTWTRGEHGDCILPRSYMLRVFAVCDGPHSWRVLPGGLTRIAGAGHEIASMQRGGSSADTWVMGEGEGEADTSTLPHHEQPAVATAPRSRNATTSRAAENLFWLGRYTERTENTARLARVTLEALNSDEQPSAPLLAWLTQAARANALVPATVPDAAQDRRDFERSLIAGLAGTDPMTSVGFNLRGLRTAASAVRERLSHEHWNVIVRAEQEFLRGCAIVTEDGDCSPVEAMRVLDALSSATAAMTGAQTDRMSRDDGWRLLSVGRHVERLGFLASALAWAFETGAVFEESGFEAVVALFDSTITLHSQDPRRHDVPALLELLVIDRDNPRALGWVAQTLRGRLAKLSGSAPGELPDIALTIPDPQQWSTTAIDALLQELVVAADRLSDDIAARYFTHSDGRRSVGA